MSILDYVSEDFKVDRELVTSRDYILNHLRAAVIPSNDVILKTGVVFRKFLDLAVIYKVVIDIPNNKIGAYNLNYDTMVKAGITEDELFEVVRQYKDYTFTPIVSAIMSYLDAPYEINREVDYNIPDVYVMTTKDCMLGASAIISESLQSIQRRLQKDFIIIPCSKMEIILIVYNDNWDLKQLKETVHMVNSTEVRPEDFLSNNLYLLNSNGVSILK